MATAYKKVRKFGHAVTLDHMCKLQNC